MMEALLSKKRWNLAAGDDEKWNSDKTNLQFLDPILGECEDAQPEQSIYLYISMQKLHLFFDATPNAHMQR